MAGLAPDNIRLGEGEPPQPGLAQPDPAQDVVVDVGPAPTLTSIDPNNQTVTIEQADGSVVVDFAPRSSLDIGEAQDHDANLALFIPEQDLGTVADDLFTAIEGDIRSRAEWLDTRATGIGLLGLKLKSPQSTPDSSGLGIATVDHPLLLDAVLRFQANARGELLPAGGPVKVRDDRPVIRLPKEPVQPPAPPPIDPAAAPPMPGAPPPVPPEEVPPGAAPPGMMPLDGAPPPGLGTPMPGVQAMGANGAPPLDDIVIPRDQMVEALEKDLNHYLTVTAKEYVPDTDRMLLYVGFGGCGFKKAYYHPLRRRPVSESVDAQYLIVSNSATDLANAGRVTHQIMMTPGVFKRMQIVGAYRDIGELSLPTPSPNAVEQKVANVQGVDLTPSRPQDAEHTIYECYCELELPGFEHVDAKGEQTGLPLPYVVVLEKDSRRVMAIRRNWEDGDDLFMQKLPFVKYPFVPGLGFYDIGLIHILGNTTRAVTAAWREMLDAGMFANFPGFLFTKSALRGQTDTTFRVAPGQGQPIDTQGSKIQDSVMELPFRDVTAGLMALIQHIEEKAGAVGGTPDIAVGDGKQDAPVGTTIALLEQATKIVDAVHKRLYAAQAEEFQLLKALFLLYPESLWRGNKKSALNQLIEQGNPEQRDLRRKAVLDALADEDIVPAADPNTPSHMHRVMKAVAIKQLAMANPQMYDMEEVDRRIFEMIHVSDIDALFNKTPPAPPEPSPDMVLGVQGELEKTRMVEENKARIASEKNETAVITTLIKEEGENARTEVDAARGIVEGDRANTNAGRKLDLEAGKAAGQLANADKKLEVDAAAKKAKEAPKRTI